MWSDCNDFTTRAEINGVTPDSDETQHLLDDLRRGDGRAFGRLIVRHQPYLCRLISLRMDTRLRGRLDASDVVQETQLEAFKRLPDYLERRPMPFRLWLRKTAQERLLMLRRRHLGAARRAVTSEVPLPDPSSVVLGRQFFRAGPSHDLDREELARLVPSAAQLPIPGGFANPTGGPFVHLNLPGPADAPPPNPPTSPQPDTNDPA